MSFWAKMAETTAIPAMPLLLNAGAFSAVMPPMATTGMETAWQMFFNPAPDTSSASVFVEVEKTAPTPW